MKISKRFLLFWIMVGLLVIPTVASSRAELTGSNSYLLQAEFLLGRDVPFTIDFDTGKISGESTGTYPTEDGTEELIKTNTVEGSYQNGEVTFALYQAGTGRKKDPCGVWEIKSQTEYTLTATVSPDQQITASGPVQMRRRLDPFMKSVAQKKWVEGQDLPPYYDVACGGQSSGFFFRDSDLAWKSSTLTGKNGEWTAKSTKPAMASIKIPSPPEDATYRKKGTTEDIPLTRSTKLEPGDEVHALSESIDIDIGDQSLTVYPYTSFRLDEASISPERIAKTRVYLLDGSVKSRIPYKPAPRGEFGVSTPGANASIRGSEMVVMYDADTNTSRIFVTEDKAFVNVKETDTPLTVSEGQMADVIDETISEPRTFSPSELPADTSEKKLPASTIWILVGGVLCIIILCGIFLNWARTRSSLRRK